MAFRGDDMRIHIEFVDGEVMKLDLKISRKDWNRRFQSALKRRRLLELRDERGEIVAINPQLAKVVRYEPEPATIVEPVPLRAPSAGNPQSRARSG
jgi:hypothetical protein